MAQRTVQAAWEREYFAALFEERTANYGQFQPTASAEETQITIQKARLAELEATRQRLLASLERDS